MSHLKFETQFANNAIIIVDGLKSTDLQTARRLHEDLLDFQMASEGQETLVHLEKVSNRQELIAFLACLVPACETGLRPIIHLECHGDKVMGLGVGDDQERVSWAELFDLLSRINIITKNNTGVVMATCQGFYALMPLTINQPCPFCFLIGSQEIVPAGVFGSQMIEFYKILYRTGQLELAMAQLDEQFKQFLAEKFFAVMWGRLLKKHGVGKGLRTRQDRLVATVLDEVRRSGKTPNVKAVRSFAKKVAPPRRETFDAYANKFLHGKSSLNFNDILQWAKTGNNKK
ncbi:MAG: hypothetical protein VR70_11130 [Rhodospirillaceae bacterium BRH_c57]|nr:MAG: hypothetical protein VR70_11130 [Rhodospirillaceae bacterium BRH_c57]